MREASRAKRLLWQFRTRRIAPRSSEAPLERVRFSALEPNTPTGLASNPWDAATAMPARVHASHFTVATSKRRSLIIKEDVHAADLCFVKALGASKEKGTGRAKHEPTKP